MAKHKLPHGQGFIDGVMALASALGYVVKEEFPVDNHRTNPPAVDVAWFGEDGQDFPLMIFEIESRATNTAANNAVKVFGQPYERFQKPLFFFHVFLSAGADTSRLETLRYQFGSHNYRTYSLDQHDSTRLINDVLSQHRRLSKQLDLVKLASVLDQPVWQDAELDVVLMHAESERFDANFLARYCTLGKNDRRFRDHYLRLLAELSAAPSGKQRSWDYGSYIGYWWPEPLHMGLLAIHRPGEDDYLRRLQHWQEKTSYITQIGPHFGLSRDYDDFLLGTAPAYLALVASLMHSVPGAGSYIADLYRPMLDRLGRAPREVSFFMALWFVHVAASLTNNERYEYARAFINDRGGIPPDLLYEPPSLVSFQEQKPDERWVQAIGENSSGVPPLAEFRRRLPSHYGRVSDLKESLTSLAMDTLTDDMSLHEWSPRIALSLHAPAGLTSART
jgi:hypothetical protein